MSFLGAGEVVKVGIFGVPGRGSGDGSGFLGGRGTERGRGKVSAGGGGEVGV